MENREVTMGVILDDEQSNLNMDCVEEISRACLNSKEMLKTARGCLNAMEREVVRSLDGTVEFDLETLMRNLGIIYMTHRNRENTLCYLMGQRMSEVDELERRMQICGSVE